MGGQNPCWGKRSTAAPVAQPSSVLRGQGYQEWSGKPGSNRRPQPWQGCALPTELFPQKLCILARQNILSSPTQTERVLAVFLALGRMFMCAAGACWLRRQAVYYSALAAVVQGCGWRPQLYSLHDSDGKAVQSLFDLV